MQNGLFKALGGIPKKPTNMSDADWEELYLKTLAAFQLCLSNEVLREVAKEETPATLWLKLESPYMTKSLTNKLRLKQQLYMLRMVEATSIRSHLDTFTIIMDLKNLEVKIDDEDKALLLLHSLPRRLITFMRPSLMVRRVSP